MEQEHICGQLKSRSKRLSNRIGEDGGEQKEREVKGENREFQIWGSLNAFHRNTV